MADFYKSIQVIYSAGSAKVNLVAAVKTDPQQIESLQALVVHLKSVATTLQKKVQDLGNEGQVDEVVSAASRLAVHCYSSAIQVLSAAIDGRESIRAAKAQMDAASKDLTKIGKSTKALIANLGKVTSVLETVGKALQIIAK